MTVEDGIAFPRARRLPAALRWLPVWRRNVLVWRKLALASILGNFGEPLLYLLALGYGLGAFVGRIGGLSYVGFLASGIVCSSAMMTATFEATYSSFTRMQPQRTWDAMLATPLEVRDIVLGEVMWAATKSVMSSGAITLVALALGVAGGWRTLLVLPMALATGFCFAGLAMVVTTLSRSYEFFMYFQTTLITPMLLLSGVFFPLSRMPAPVREASHVLPLWHAVVVVRPLMTGGAVTAPLLHVAVLAAWGAAGLALATRLAHQRLSR